MTQIRFDVNPSQLPSGELVLTLLEAAGTSFPDWTPERMDRAIKNSAAVVLAWHGDELIGFARAISDFAWCGYLSQLAVAPAFQRQGIGKKLVARVLERLGPEVSLLVHAADGATDFYDAVGFEPYSNVYRFKRTR